MFLKTDSYMLLTEEKKLENAKSAADCPYASEKKENRFSGLCLKIS